MRISDWSSDVCSSDLELAFGARLRQVGDRLPLKNGIDRRDRLHTKLRRDKGIFIDIDLDQLDALGRIFCTHLLDDGRKLFARAAPFRPEIDDNQRCTRWIDYVTKNLQIGRAACRARVCQDVRIWGVAGDVKKKNKEKNKAE